MHRITGKRRWAAVGAVLLAFAAVVLAVITLLQHFPNGLSVLVCLALGIAAVAYAIVRRGATRTLGLVAAGLLFAGAVVLIVVENSLLENLLVLAAVLGALAAARQAFRGHAHYPPARPPAHPVLFYNPKSGGGKAERFHLASEARRRGIEPIELALGDDLEQLVRTAVNRGADALAMAGGDGSQAIVAMVAAELDLPYACVPAGTRNHFALDLGVDRDDVVGALDAFVDGGERRVDLAEVNGQVFVNNVSLGLYAEAVQRPGYREAKLHTLLETVPDTIGPHAHPATITCTGPEGRESAAAILVSNNPYRLGRALGSGTRPRLDLGTLGIAVLVPLAPSGEERRRQLGLQQWTAPQFEIDGDGRLPVGIDGEAVQLEAPLRFRIRRRALRVRIAPGHPGLSPSALEPDTPWQVITALLRIAVRGREPPALGRPEAPTGSRERPRASEPSNPA